MIDDRSARFAKVPWSTTPNRGQRPLPMREPRICAEPGCGAHTSRYNLSERCWLHAEHEYPVPPGGRKVA